jgi:hypothetical protein
MVNKALVLKNRRGILLSKRQTQQNTNPRPRMNVSSSPARPIFCHVPQSSQHMPQPSGQGFVTPQQQMIQCPNLFQTPNNGNQSAQGTPSTQNATLNKENTTCFNYGQKGHYANRCPSRRKSSTPTLGTPTPPSSRNGSSTPTQAQQNYAPGRLNQVLMEEATSLVNSILS